MKKALAFKVLPFLFALGLTACNNDDDSVTLGLCQITNLEIVGDQSSVITYGSNNQIVKTTVDKVTGADYYEEFEYNNLGQLSKMKMFQADGVQLDYFALEYNSQGLLKKESYFRRLNGTGNYQHEYDRIYEFNAQKQIVKVLSYEPGQAEVPNSKASGYEQLTYDERGNVASIIEYVLDDDAYEKTLTYEYTYDTNKNPYMYNLFYGASAVTLSRNNILTEKETYHLSGQVKNYTTAYEYNQDGYPNKKTVTTNSGNTIVTNLGYSCY